MEKRIHLQNIDDEGVIRPRERRLVSESKGQEFDRDRYELARVGKEQVLKVSDLLSSRAYSDLIYDSVALGWCQ